MSINKNGKNVKYVRKDKNLAQSEEMITNLDSSRLSNVLKPQNEELKPELISWDESISEMDNSLKTSLKDKYYPHLVLLGGLLFAGSFFFLGRMSNRESLVEPIAVSYINEISNSRDLAAVVESGLKDSAKTQPTVKKQVIIPTPNTSGEVIGSKSGKKYYFPWCGTVKRIKPENQVHFASIEAAKAAGFTPGGNCKGIY